MPEEAEACDVGRRSHAGFAGEVGRVAIEAKHGGDGAGHPAFGLGVGSTGGDDDAGAEGLREIEVVARPETRFREEPTGVDQAEHAEAVLRFVVPDGVAAGDDATGLKHLIGASAEDLGLDLWGETFGECGDVECEDDFATHGEDIRHGIGGRDGPVGVGVVDEGCEEVKRSHDRGRFVDAKDGGVVGDREPDEYVGVVLDLELTSERRQNLCQGLGPSLRGSTAAASQIGKPDLLTCHWGIVPQGRRVFARSRVESAEMAARTPGQAASGAGGRAKALPPPVIMARLSEVYGWPEPMPHGDPLAELILTVLSQNTADTNSGRAFTQLMRRYPSWEAVADAPLPELVETIQRGGLAQQKAPRIQAILRTVRERSGDWDLGFLEGMELAEAREWLRSLPGVGPKTAACVLLFALGRPAMPVDTHVERVAKRLGLIPPKLTAEQAHDALEAIVDPKDYYPFHMLLIKHGRRLCGARRPLCERCPLEPECPASRLKPERNPALP